MERERTDSGRYNDRIDPDSVLTVFEERDDQAEPITAGDVVDQMDIARRTAHNKLNRLVERGTLETKKVGARSRVWWIPQSGHSPTAESPEPVADPSTEPQQGPAENEPPAQETTATSDGLKEQLQSTLPGSGSTLEKRANAVLTMYEHLRDNQGETIPKSDLTELVDGSDLGFDDTHSFWKNAVLSAHGNPNALTSLPGVEGLGNGRYQYAGE